MELSYTFAGLAVGLLVGLTGVGGGSLMTPLLIYAFGVNPVTAVGTDLLFAAITKSGAAVTHARRCTVNWRVVGLLALGSLPATGAMLYGLSRFDHSPALDQIIITALGFALIVTAVALLFKQRLIRLLAPRKEASGAFTVLAGAMIGALVAITSVGAGALGVMVLFLLHSRLTMLHVVGTDIVHAALLSAVAGLGHAHLGTVDYLMLGQLLLGSLPGIYLGTHLCSRMPERALQYLLAGMLFVVGLKFVA